MSALEWHAPTWPAWGTEAVQDFAPVDAAPWTVHASAYQYRGGRLQVVGTLTLLEPGRRAQDYRYWSAARQTDVPGRRDVAAAAVDLGRAIYSELSLRGVPSDGGYAWLKWGACVIAEALAIGVREAGQ